MALETRSLVTEFRQDPNDERTFSARVLNYGIVDQHKTKWEPGVFTESLRAKLPKAVFSHDWQRPIGRVTSYDDSTEGLDVTVRLADFDSVPDARMAHSMLADGILDQFSFGFVRQADKPDPDDKTIRIITQARMDEVSPVLVGSVPGTRTLAVRTIPEVDQAEVQHRVMARTPHQYKATNGDGSVCSTCGGAPEIKAHETARSAEEIVKLAAAMASAPLEPADAPSLVAATDAALDAALALGHEQDMRSLPPWVGQMFALLAAADATADAALDELEVEDPDTDVEVTRAAFAFIEVRVQLPEEIATRIGTLGQRRRRLVSDAPKA